MDAKTVWKYVIDEVPGVSKRLSMPPGASPLRVGMQNGKVCLWACVVPCEEALLETRLFFFTGTGHPVPAWAKYIDGCKDGPFEWHVWEDQ